MNNGKAFSSFDDMACSDSALTNFSFSKGTDKAKGTAFPEIFKNPIYYKIVLITPGIIWSFKLKAKEIEKVLVCGITNTNIKKNY